MKRIGHRLAAFAALPTIALCLPSLLFLGLMTTSPAFAAPSYLGETDSVVVSAPGCNAMSLVQIPDSSDLFINRQLLTDEGRIAGLGGPNDCSGGNQDNIKAGKVYGRWSLTLNRLNWSSHKLDLVKPVLDTSIDDRTGHSRAIITDGPMRGAIIQSAYDADVVNFHGKYIISFECIIEDGSRFEVDGASSCVGVYNPTSQTVDLSRTRVVVTGLHQSDGKFYAAGIPHLLIFKDNIYMYWSCLLIENGVFRNIAARGAQLDANGDFLSVKGGLDLAVRSNDDQLTTEVWAPDLSDPLANNAVDIRVAWMAGDKIVAISGEGGDGCATPAGKSKGCFALAIVKTDQPLSRNGFGKAQKIQRTALPSNPQEYTRPIRDPEGNYWLVGHFLKPTENGESELRPAPGGNFWQKPPRESALIMFPFPERSLWPNS